MFAKINDIRTGNNISPAFSYRQKVAEYVLLKEYGISCLRLYEGILLTSKSISISGVLISIILATGLLKRYRF